MKMDILKQAAIRYSSGFGYNATRRFVLWKSSKVAWHHITISYGIRNSDLYQVFPIWNTSDNSTRSLLFGLGKVFFEVSYHRARPFNQNRLLLFRRPLWRFYQLIL